MNEARISGQRNNAIGSDTTPGTPQGVGQTPIVPTENELPVTVIGGAFNMFGTLAPSVSPTNQLQVADQISWSHGKHTIRAGFEAKGLVADFLYGSGTRLLVLLSPSPIG